MKSRRFRIIAVVLLCISIAGYVFLKSSRNKDTIASRISNMVFENNPIKLECSGIDEEQVSVAWAYNDCKSLIVRHGKKISSVGYEYGLNGFDILIPQTTLHAGHWKTANWHSHDYTIRIAKNVNGYLLTFIAAGPDYEHTEEQFDLNGSRNGTSRSYYRNGHVSREQSYKNGLPEGNALFYDENGKVRRR